MADGKLTMPCWPDGFGQPGRLRPHPALPGFGAVHRLHPAPLSMPAHFGLGRDKNRYAVRPKRRHSRLFLRASGMAKVIWIIWTTTGSAIPTLLPGFIGNFWPIPEYRLAFGDRVHKHLFNGGALSSPRLSKPVG